MSTTVIISSGTVVVEDISPFSPIQSVAASTDPGVIVRDSAWTVAKGVATGASGTYSVKLDTGFQSGDLVNVLWDYGQSGSFVVKVSSASEYIINEVGTPHSLSANAPVSLRKISSFEWVIQR